MAFWVMSAKRDETRARRLALLIDCSRRGMTIPQLTRPTPAATTRARSPARPAAPRGRGRRSRGAA
ncbi:hypothetical protein D3C83_315430 [compost metagenome]